MTLTANECVVRVGFGRPRCAYRSTGADQPHPRIVHAVRPVAGRPEHRCPGRCRARGDRDAGAVLARPVLRPARRQPRCRADQPDNVLAYSPDQPARAHADAGSVRRGPRPGLALRAAAEPEQLRGGMLGWTFRLRLAFAMLAESVGLGRMTTSASARPHRNGCRRRCAACVATCSTPATSPYAEAAGYRSLVRSAGPAHPTSAPSWRYRRRPAELAGQLAHAGFRGQKSSPVGRRAGRFEPPPSDCQRHGRAPPGRLRIRPGLSRTARSTWPGSGAL